jgi:hypothetical protein
MPFLTFQLLLVGLNFNFGYYLGRQLLLPFCYIIDFACFFLLNSYERIYKIEIRVMGNDNSQLGLMAEGKELKAIVIKEI